MSSTTLPGPKRRKEYQVRYDDHGDVILPFGAEFVDGKVAFKNRTRAASMSEASNFTGGRAFVALSEHVLSNRLGVVFYGASDQGYQCFPNKPDQVRKPDVSFVRRRELDVTFDGWTPDVPELVVEVISPADKIYELESRIRDFRSAGTKLFWVIDPINRKAEVIRTDGVKWPVNEEGILDGEDVLPGFKLPLVSILPPKKSEE